VDNWDKRVQATAFIWLALAAALGFSGLGDASNFSDEIIAIVVSAAALLSTATIWYFGRESAPAAQSEKNKRNTSDDARTRLLLEMLDDKERQTLKHRLMDELNTDGESLSLVELLTSQDSKNRQR